MIKQHSIEELQGMFEGMGLGLREQNPGLNWPFERIVATVEMAVTFIRAYGSTMPIKEDSNAKLE